MKKHFVNILAAVAILGSVACMIAYWFPRPVKLDLSPYRATGEVLAGEAVKLADGKGKIVVVAYEKTGGATGAILEAVRKAVSQRGGPPVVVEKTGGKANPGDEGIVFPAALYFEIPQKHPEVSVIVSLLGQPRLSDEEIQMAASGAFPKVVASGCNGYKMKALLEGNVVQAMVVSDYKGFNGTAPKTPREWFDRFYKIVTPQDAASMPAAEGAAFCPSDDRPLENLGSD